MQMYIKYGFQVKKPDNISDERWDEFHKALSDLCKEVDPKATILGIQPLDWNLIKDPVKPFIWEFAMSYDEYSLDFAADNLENKFLTFAQEYSDIKLIIHVLDYNWTDQKDKMKKKTKRRPWKHTSSKYNARYKGSGYSGNSATKQVRGCRQRSGVASKRGPGTSKNFAQTRMHSSAPRLRFDPIVKKEIKRTMTGWDFRGSIFPNKRAANRAYLERKPEEQS